MSGPRFWMFSVSALAALAAAGSAVSAVVGSDEPQIAGVEAGAVRQLPDSTDMELRFIQEDGPESGHVRVELTPQTRPLTPFEVRSAAQQGFLEALNEPGLGDELKRITVVVRFNPAFTTPGVEQSFVYVSTGGRNWSIRVLD